MTCAREQPFYAIGENRVNAAFFAECDFETGFFKEICIRAPLQRCGTPEGVP
jgi:hypothetical protein